jgi:hypothetical protein
MAAAGGVADVALILSEMRNAEASAYKSLANNSENYKNETYKNSFMSTISDNRLLNRHYEHNFFKALFEAINILEKE